MKNLRLFLVRAESNFLILIQSFTTSKNLREKIKFITTNDISPDLDFIMNFRREFQILEEEKSKFLESTRLI